MLPLFYAQTAQPPVNPPIAWAVLGVIVLAGLCVGFADVRRLSLVRIWALARVAFVESMRRRVLLVTLLAIAGVVVVAQLQQNPDDQDSIRQTGKFCVFASGLVVVVTSLMLACTNLPREIESRVVFTIVTKPTTRLEIMLGKVLGFSCVAAAILGIMGLFTYGYLEVLNHQRVRGVEASLTSLPADALNRPSLEHFASHGFLETRSLDFPADLSIYSRTDDKGGRWIRGGEPQFILVHFVPTAEQRDVLAAAVQANAEVQLVASLQLLWHPLSPEDQTMARQMSARLLNPPAFGPQVQVSDTGPVRYAPIIRLRMVDERQENVVNPKDLNARAEDLQIVSAEGSTPSGVLDIGPKAIAEMSTRPEFALEVAMTTPGVEYGIGTTPLSIVIPAANNGQGLTIKPSPAPDGAAAIQYLSRPGRVGMILAGHADEARSVADYHFRGASAPDEPGGKASFQFDARIERVGDFSKENLVSAVELQVINTATGRSSGPIRVTPEFNRMVFFDVPSEAVAGGDFVVRMRGLAEQQWIDLQPDSIALITADRSFCGNLFKSFLLLWMMAVLVVSISVFCSTFLSWPIAIVLALLLLLGHWGVVQLGDALRPGVGRMITGDFQVRDPTQNRVVSTSIEALARSLRALSVVLPDLAAFPASELLERGISIPFHVLVGALEALLIYGLSVVVAGYILLRYKEVAP